MARRYITLSHKPELADIDSDPDGENYLSRTIYENEPVTVRTGLLDASGNDIYMREENDPIGFVWWDSDQA